MTDNNIMYTIYKIYDINNEMTFYGKTKEIINKVLNKYKYFYKKYSIDKSNKYNQKIFNIFDKYDFDNIFIMEIDKDNNLENIKEKIHNLIKNDKNCINFKNKMTKDELINNNKFNKSKWRICNKEYIKEYMNKYFQKNNEKKDIYYKNSLLKLNNIYKCACNSNILLKSKLLHDKSLKHRNYINSL